MHELGIVFHIAKKVESIAVENHVSHVAKVVLEIGEVSTVVPSYLEDCWKWKCTPRLRYPGAFRFRKSG